MFSGCHLLLGIQDIFDTGFLHDEKQKGDTLDLWELFTATLSFCSLGATSLPSAVTADLLSDFSVDYRISTEACWM